MQVKQLALSVMISKLNNLLLMHMPLYPVKYVMVQMPNMQTTMRLKSFLLKMERENFVAVVIV